MGLVFLVAVVVTLSLSPACSQRASTCMATLCQNNTVCREVLDRAKGIVVARCLNPNVYLSTGRDKICSDGQALWVSNDNGGYSEAACGRVVDRVTCPNSYTCVIAPDDTYSLCCPSPRPLVKSGECPLVISITVFKPCPSLCKVDSDCKDDLKCCKNSCGGFVCQKPEKDVCRFSNCKPGFVCNKQLKGHPCVPEKKEGKCPAIKISEKNTKCQSSCQTDGECSGHLKCCSANKFCKRCEEPEASHTCENKKCNPGEKCIMQKVQCIKAPCFDIPTCV